MIRNLLPLRGAGLILLVLATGLLGGCGGARSEAPGKGQGAAAAGSVGQTLAAAPLVVSALPIHFGPVWCPRTHNGGGDFHRITRYEDLPNDPIGNGRDNCYMAAYDTSIFSSDGKPVSGCANLDLRHFPGHRCREVSSAQQLKSLSAGTRQVAIITRDLELPQDQAPYLASGQESLVVIGTYNPENLRPVLLSGARPGPSTFFYWNVNSERSQMVLINLRMLGSNCVQLGDRGQQKTLVGVSLTGKCIGRLLMADYEQRSEAHPLDNRLYLKNILARAKNSHTIYMDRTYLNWIEDSLLMGPWIPGKHAAKFTGQNVVLRNSLLSNEGVHGQPVEDPDYADPKRPWLGKGGLAPVSMASCNRAVLDGVTVVNHVVRGNSNPQAIQWQFRDALGAGCDMPRIYRQVDGEPGDDPYYGPTWYEGRLEEPSSAWQPAFWQHPRMLESYLVRSRVIQSYGENPGHGRYYALMSDGTYPSVRDSDTATVRRPASKIPPGWIERQRIHVSGNCLDDGVDPGSLFSNHVLPGMGGGGRHDFDNTYRFVAYGSNRCAAREAVAPDIEKALQTFIASLPLPLWQDWQAALR
ncbi:MAG: hypothetical protein ACK5HY_11095 [Parahaliea sp.]